jgi:hypothetical protein
MTPSQEQVEKAVRKIVESFGGYVISITPIKKEK